LLCALVLQVNGRSVILRHYAFFFSLEEKKTQNLSLSSPPFHKLTKWSSTFIMCFSIFD
jgi:hypothetical protein